MIVIKINPTSHSYYDYPMTMAGTKTGVSTVRVERIDGDAGYAPGLPGMPKDEKYLA